MPHIAMGWFQGARNNLQQGGLTATIGANDTDSDALLKLKAHLLQGPEFLVPAQAAARQRLFQPIGWTQIGPVLL